MTTITNASLRTLNKVVGALSILGWVFFIAALSVLHYARPDPTNIYDTIVGSIAQAEWNLSLSSLFFIFLCLGLLLSLIALAFNIFLFRSGRTHLWINLILLILASVTTGLYYYFSIH